MEASDGTANDGENVLVDAGNDAVLGSIGAEGDIRLDVTRNLTVTEALDGNGDLDVIATSATFGDTVTVDDAGSGAIAVEADSVRFEGDVSATSLDVNGDATIATGEIVTAEGQVWQGPVTIEFADGTRLLGTLVTLANGSTGDALDVVGDSRIQGQFTNTSLLFVGTTTLTGTTQIQPAGMNETSDGQLVRAAVHFDGAVLSDGGAQELTVTLGGNEWVVFGGDVGTGGQALGTVTVERDGGSVGQAVLILDGSVLSAESFVFDLEGGVDGPDGATFATIWTVGEDLQFAPQPEGENPPPSVTFEVGSSFEMSSTDSLTTAGGLLIDGEAATVTLNDLNVVGLVDVNASSIVLQDGSDYVSFTGFDFSVTPTRTGGGEAGLPTFGSPDGDADLSGFGALQNFRVLAFTDEIVIGDFGSGVSVFDLAPVGPSIQDVSEGLAGALPTTEGAQPVRAASSLGQAEREALEENLRLTIRELDEDERIAFAEGAGAVLEDPLLLTTVADPDDLIPPRKAERFNAAELQALGQRIVDGQEPLDGAMEAVAIEAFTTFEREEGRTPTDEEWTLAVASLIERGGAEVIQEQTRMIREGLEYFREIDRRLAAAGMTNAERQPYIDAWLSNELYNPRAFIPVRTPAVYAEWRQLTESPAVAEQPAIEEQVPTEEPAE